MTTDPMSADAFTQASVEAYVQAATEERVRLEIAISQARARLARATAARDRLDLLAAAEPPSGQLSEPPSDGVPTR